LDIEEKSEELKDWL